MRLGRAVRDEVSESDQDVEPEGHESGSALRSSLNAAFASTLTSLLVVLVLLLAVRLIVPSLVEEIRYAWFRGQLRAQYETSDQALQQVSLDGLNGISKAISQRVGPSVVHINVRDVVDSRWSELLGDKAAPKRFCKGRGVVSSLMTKATFSLTFM